MRIMVAQRMSNRKIMMFLFIRYSIASSNLTMKMFMTCSHILVDEINGLGLKEMGQCEYMSKIVPFL
jgi:hypothetical protein